MNNTGPSKQNYFSMILLIFLDVDEIIISIHGILTGDSLTFYYIFLVFFIVLLFLMLCCAIAYYLIYTKKDNTIEHHILHKIYLFDIKIRKNQKIKLELAIIVAISFIIPILLMIKI